MITVRCIGRSISLVTSCYSNDSKSPHLTLVARAGDAGRYDVTGEREPERAGEAPEAGGDAERGPSTSRRRAEQRAAGGAQRLAANAGRTSQTASDARRTAGTLRRARQGQQTTFGRVCFIVSAVSGA